MLLMRCAAVLQTLGARIVLIWYFCVRRTREGGGIFCTKSNSVGQLYPRIRTLQYNKLVRVFSQLNA